MPLVAPESCWRMPYTRSVRIAAPHGHNLEARISLPSSRREPENALIAPPHPLYGGDIENPVVRALEGAFHAHGLGTVAFNFRGTGASGGTQRGDLDEGLEDYLAVARSAEAAPVRVLSGYSFGAAVALRAASELRLARLVLVAPATALFDPALMRSFAGSLRVVVGDDDDYAPHETLRELLSAAPDARLEVLPRTDHFFQGAQLTRLADALSSLIA